MTHRKEILSAIVSDLLKLKKANGYLHDAPAVSTVRTTLADCDSFPAINISLRKESFEPNEAGTESNLLVEINTHIKTSTDVSKSGLITNETEDWIDDYLNFFKSPELAGNLGIISGLWKVAGVVDYFISDIEPYADWKENSSTLRIQLTVNYFSN